MQRTLIENIVAYFACEYHDKCGSWPYLTWLYKALALLDFRSLHIYGHPATCLEYSAHSQGAVPDGIYKNKDNLPFAKFHLEKIKSTNYVVTAEEPDCDMIPGMYIDMIDELCEEFACPGISADGITNASHNEIKAWKPTWKRAKRINSANPPVLPILYDEEMEYIKDPRVQDAYIFYKECKELDS